MNNNFLHIKKNSKVDDKMMMEIVHYVEKHSCLSIFNFSELMILNPQHTHTQTHNRMGIHNPIQSTADSTFKADADAATESELCSPGERHQIHESEFIVLFLLLLLFIILFIFSLPMLLFLLSMALNLNILFHFPFWKYSLERTSRSISLIFSIYVFVF